MERLKQFFWLCSGASFSLLKKSPSESSKYAGIGATIFFTGLLAAISGGYALFYVFNSKIFAVIFGLIWGLMIFNLDRYIVLSMRKSEIWYKEWLQGLPRIILAILIAFVISKPLELKIFEKEIATELTVLKQEVLKNQEVSLGQRFATELDSLNKQIGNLNAETENSRVKRDELVELARQEADGTGGSMKRNPGPIYRIKKANADKAQAELDELKQKNDAEIAEIHQRIEQINQEKATYKSNMEDPNLEGISFKLTALGRLGEKYSAIFLANLLIIMLFIVLETAPIVTKLISNAGPYDHLLEAHEHEFKNFKKQKIHQADIKLEQFITENS